MPEHVEGTRTLLRYPLTEARAGRLWATMLSGLSPAMSATSAENALEHWLRHLLHLRDERRMRACSAVRALTEGVPTATGSNPAASLPTPATADSTNPLLCDEGWQGWPFNMICLSYPVADHWWNDATADVPGVSDCADPRAAGATRQILDALAPSNLILTNPELLTATIAQRGANLRRGARHLAEDWGRFLAGRRPVGAERFLPGKHVAQTPGMVVYRNSLLELIQYAPATRSVYAEPVLVIPPWFHKYYIVDLSSHNSLVGYLVARGHTVFVISWKSASANDRRMGFDAFRSAGVMAAIDAMSGIVPRREIHAVGYCLGGTVMAATAAAMAGAGDRRLRTLTLLAAQVDFTDRGDLAAFVDEDFLRSVEDLEATQGYVDSRQVIVPLLLWRAREFLWPLLLQQYTRGEREPLTDRMAWFTDAIRLPGQMSIDYLRGLWLGNELARGRYEVDGRRLSVSSVTIPIFAVGALDDFIAPWRSVFRIHYLTEAEITFAIADGDHYSAIVADPGEPQRRFTIARSGQGQPRLDADRWRDQAPHREGCWWSEWQEWLALHSGERDAPPLMGNPAGGYPPLDEAPGQYVRLD